jgi:hypothetical protein
MRGKETIELPHARFLGARPARVGRRGMAYRKVGSGIGQRALCQEKSW